MASLLGNTMSKQSRDTKEKQSDENDKEKTDKKEEKDILYPVSRKKDKDKDKEKRNSSPSGKKEAKRSMTIEPVKTVRVKLDDAGTPSKKKEKTDD